MKTSTWGPGAFRGVPGQSRGRARTRRIIATLGLAVLATVLVLLVTFVSAGRGTDEVMVAVGAAVASVASLAAVRSVQAAMAYREKPYLDDLRARQEARLGSIIVPAAMERIQQELHFAGKSRKYYRRVLAQRMRRLAAAPGFEHLYEDNEVPQTSPLEDRITELGEPGDQFIDKLPERLTRRGVETERLVELINEVEATRSGTYDRTTKLD